jgi:adenine phosphoribosyltransferase
VIPLQAEKVIPLLATPATDGSARYHPIGGAGTIHEMKSEEVVGAGRAGLLARFAWEGGHANVWQVFGHGLTLVAIVAGLAEPWREAGFTHVVGIESRGVLLGGAVATNLGGGFQAVRKSGGMLPGPKLTTTTAADYRGIVNELRMQDVLTSDDVVLLVDDWA